jgi:hypothetical protein
MHAGTIPEPCREIRISDGIRRQCARRRCPPRTQPASRLEAPRFKRRARLVNDAITQDGAVMVGHTQRETILTYQRPAQACRQ